MDKKRQQVNYDDYLRAISWYEIGPGGLRAPCVLFSIKIIWRFIRIKFYSFLIMSILQNPTAINSLSFNSWSFWSWNWLPSSRVQISTIWTELVLRRLAFDAFITQNVNHISTYRSCTDIRVLLLFNYGQRTRSKLFRQVTLWSIYYSLRVHYDLRICMN